MSSRLSAAACALVLAVACTVLLAGATATPDAAERLYQDALATAQRSHDPQDKERALDLLRQALAKSPEHLPSLNYQAGLLLELRRYQEAEAALERLWEAGKHPQALLTLCMVREHLSGPGATSAACYQRAAQHFLELYEGEAGINFGYLLSLKMGGFAEFEAALATTLDAVGETETAWGPGLVNLEVLEDDRNQLLREFLGIVDG